VRTEMLAFAHDPKLNITFTYSALQVFEVHMDNEDRDVWEMYLQKVRSRCISLVVPTPNIYYFNVQGQFAEAQRYCKEPWQRDKVWTTQAEFYFNQKQYELAAQYYGKTMKSFEEITLKFIHIGETDALRAFLKEKLAHMKPETDAMHMTILCTWLTELYLNKLNQLESSFTKSLW